MLNEKPTIRAIFRLATINKAKSAMATMLLATKFINALTPFPITIPVSDKIVLLKSALLRLKNQLYGWLKYLSIKRLLILY